MVPQISPVSTPSLVFAFDCAKETFKREFTCLGKYGLSPPGGGANVDGRWRRERGIEDKFVKVLIADFQLVHQFQFFIQSLIDGIARTTKGQV